MILNFPNYSDIIYFLEVSKTLNVSRAAEKLGLSQPSLSAAIKRLEDSLDSHLLIRTKSGVQLTKAGHTLVAQSKELLAQWENIKNSLQQSNEEALGRYKIGCHSSVALYTLHTFLPQLLKAHKKLELDLIHDLSRLICEKIISFEIDFGIVVNPVSHPDLVIKDLCRDQVRFWSSGKLKSVDTDTLICDPSLLQSQDLLLKLKKHKVNFSRIIHSGSLEVIAQLVSTGAGVGILPERVVDNANLNLKIFDQSLPLFEDRICLVYRALNQKSIASRKIIDAVLTFK